MVKQFLLDYEQELLEQRIDITKLLQNNEISIRENKEYIQYIINSEDRCYESFSPQSFRNTENEKNIKKLEEEQKKLEATGEELQLKMQSISDKLEKLDNILKEIRKYEIKSGEPCREEKNVEVIKEDMLSDKLPGILQKIQLCEKLLDIDKDRCRIELHNIYEILKCFT